MAVGTYLERPGGQEREDLEARLRNVNDPFLVGMGPAEFSTSMALEPWPSIIWDTNLYYRDMGVRTKASRKEIRTRYQEIQGDQSVRLTMIAEVLLNVERRLLYDLVPLGALFFDNEIEEAMRAKVTDAITKRLEDGEDFDDVISEDGDQEIQDQLTDAEQLKTNRALRANSWSYYLWRSDCQDMMKIHEWRTLLCQWFWHYDHAPTNIGIGFMGGDDHPDVAVKKVGSRTIVFVHDQLEPSDVIACIAVAEMRRHNNSPQ